MLPGLGLIRRGITLLLCGSAFWAGLQWAQWVQVTEAYSTTVI